MADLPVEEMGLLPFVEWDRYTEDGKGGVSMVFGWIARPDGRSDFVILRPTEGGLGFSTSSAEYSEEISRLLRGGELSETHQTCIRVESHPDAESLANVVRLTALAGKSGDVPVIRESPEYRAGAGLREAARQRPGVELVSGEWPDRSGSLDAGGFEGEKSSSSDQRSPLRGWAPGRYYSRCRTCGKPFEGDKRAITCAGCAYSNADCLPVAGRAPDGLVE